MEVAYEVGNFSKLAARLLKPGALRFKYQHIKGTAFGREKQDWVEGFHLQQSAHGRGDFCVNIGFWIPKQQELWGAERSFSLMIWDRMGPHGTGETWYGAENTVQLKASLELVEQGLQVSESWFSKINTLSDLADEYESRNNLPESGHVDHLSSIAIVNFGFLLLLADRKDEARHWLNMARTYWQLVVAENQASASRRRPGREVLAYHQDDLQRLTAIVNALRMIDQGSSKQVSE